MHISYCSCSIMKQCLCFVPYSMLMLQHMKQCRNRTYRLQVVKRVKEVSDEAHYVQLLTDSLHLRQLQQSKKHGLQWESNDSRNTVYYYYCKICIVHKFKHAWVGGAGVTGWENGQAGEGYKWVLRWRLPDTEWDGIPNCWSCKSEGFTTNGRGGERNM